MNAKSHSPRIGGRAALARIGILFGLFALAGCAGVLGGGSEAAGPVPVGKDLVGEACTTYPAPPTEVHGIGDRMQLVKCGTWTYPSARIFELGRNEPVATLAQNGAWRSFVSERMVCDNGQPTTILSGDPAVMLSCKLRSGGWTFLALAADVDGKGYLADGIPAALPAIEQSILAMNGQLTAAGKHGVASQSAAIRRLQQELQGHLFGSGDLQNYFALMQQGQYFDTTLDFADAEKDYRDALAIHERILGPDNPDGADPMMSLALEISNQGRYREADALFQRAARLSEDASPALRARLVSYEAINDANRGKRSDALALARRATSLREGIKSAMAADGSSLPSVGPGGPIGGTDSAVLVDPLTEAAIVDIVQSRFIEASMLLKNHEVTEARTVAARALSDLGQVRVHPEWWLPRLYELDARIATASGDLPEAESALKSAAAAWPRIYEDSRPEGLAYFALGQNLEAQGQTEQALDAFRKGDRILTADGGGLTFDEVRPYLDAALHAAETTPSERQSLYSEMFHAAQLVRGSITSRTISLAAARLSTTNKPVGAVIRKKQDAERQRDALLARYNELVAAPPDLQDKNALDNLRQEIAAAEKEVADLDQQVQAVATGYNQLLDVPVDAASTLKLLHPHEALVSFLLGAPRSFAFVLAGGQITAYPLDTTEAEVAKMVETLRRGTEVTADGRVPPFNLKLAYALYEKLFQPFAATIAGDDHLIVAASGPLLSIPPDILLTKAPTSDDYRTAAWFVRAKTISTVTSVRSFVDLRKVAKPSQAPKPFIGFGGFIPPHLTPATSGIPAGCGAEYKELASLGALPGTVTELHGVGDIVGGAQADIEVGHAFTKEAVMKADLSDFRVVYFATHALLPTDLQCRPEPALLASLPVGSNDISQMFIDNKDVMNLDLDADLVVLSACNTDGPDGRSAGESLSGLARSFFYAGARGLIVTHWEAEDEATAYLMKQTFADLVAGEETPAEALRQAKLSMIDGAGEKIHSYWSHPIFWGPFASIGDGGRPWHGNTRTAAAESGSTMQ